MSKQSLKMLEVSKKWQWIYGIIVAFGGVGFGMSLSWTATALPSIQNTQQFGCDLTSTEKSLIGSFLMLGALISCPLTAYGMNTYGRKPALFYLCLVGLAGWVVMGVGNRVVHLYVGRILTGIYAGGSTIVIPVYVKEIAGLERRGAMGSLFQIMLCVGKLISNVLGIMMPANAASMLSVLQPFLHIMLLVPIPESSAFLVKLKADTDNDKPTSVSSGFTLYCKPISIVLFLMLLAQFCGINVATFFTKELFNAEDSQLTPKVGLVSLAVIQLIGSLPTSIIVDKYGRKILLLSSVVLMALCTGMLSGYYYFTDILDNPSFKDKSYIPLALLATYSLAYSWGVGSIVWIIMSEIIPTQIIAQVSSLATFVYWISAFLITLVYQLYNNQVALFLWFASFCLVCVVGAPLILWFVPETIRQNIKQSSIAEEGSNTTTK